MRPSTSTPPSARTGATKASHSSISSQDRREPTGDTGKDGFQVEAGNAASLAENPRAR